MMGKPSKAEAVKDVMTREVSYWRELAQRHGAEVTETTEDSGAVILMIREAGPWAWARSTLAISVAPARGGRIATRTRILLMRGPYRSARLKSVVPTTRQMARYAIENMGLSARGTN